MTPKTSLIFPLSLLFLAAPLVGLAGPVEAAEERDARCTCEEAESILTVTGRGEVHVRPDSVRVRVAVETQAERASPAREEANRKAQAIVSAVKALGVPGLSLETQAANLTPVYSSRENEDHPTIIGYRAENALLVTITEAKEEELGALASRVIEAAEQAGANSVRGIDLFVKDENEARARALRAAVADAEAKAQAVADTGGLTLVQMKSVDTGDAGSPVPIGIRGAMAMDESAAPPIETGEQTIAASVTVRFVFTQPKAPKPAASR
jgi:uncharacterized protein